MLYTPRQFQRWGLTGRVLFTVARDSVVRLLRRCLPLRPLHVRACTSLLITPETDSAGRTSYLVATRPLNADRGSLTISCGRRVAVVRCRGVAKKGPV